MYIYGECKKKGCRTGNEADLPLNCPTRDHEIVEDSRKKYTGENLDIAKAASKTEYEGYCVRTRVEEIMEFADSMGYRKLGIVHCVGLSGEAGSAAKVFRANGFEVETVCCKAGAIDKCEFGMQEFKLKEGFEAICNPIGQAMYVEKSGCDLAVIVGLCVGHDTLFIKEVKIPATYLIVKDRALGHNPAAALYCGYYFNKRLLPPTRKKEKITDFKCFYNLI